MSRETWYLAAEVVRQVVAFERRKAVLKANIDKEPCRQEREKESDEGIEIGAWRPDDRLPAAPLLDGRHRLLLLVLAALGEQFLRLRGLGGLNLAKEDSELFLGKFVPAQQWFKRVHEKHLNADELSEDMHLHLRLTRAFKAMQEDTAHPVGECHTFRPREVLKGCIFAVSETRRQDAVPGKRALGAIGRWSEFDRLFHR